MQPNNTSREVLLALRERVLAAKGGDRELDAEIARALDLVPDGALHMIAGPDPGAFAKSAYAIWRAPRLSGSVDAALRLFDSKLTDWSREVGRSGFGNPAWCRAWNPALSPGANNEVRSDHNGGSEPLAICAALLTALAGG